MTNFIIFSINYFFFGFLMFMLGLMFYYYDLVLMMNWNMIDLNSMEMNLMFYIDWMSLMFIGVVMLIFSSVMFYSMEYMYGEIYINRFIYLVMLFVFSMFLMILSPSIMTIIIGWDGLGLISYCLIIYYQNISSYNSGMLTILCNRLGDIMLILSMCYVMFFGSWNLILYSDLSYMNMLLLVICAMTKSAQFPFSIWLPAAMAAPTPVSSLVHSSTLVTAGVYLMIRLIYFLELVDLNYNLLLISSLTMFMSGVVANFEFDLKKIIALSTLSQLGLMMSILSLGYSDLSFFHLLTHAMFKSLLFLCAGSMIHMMMNNQDIRYYGGMFNKMPFSNVCMLISVMSLCGFPFMSGFYSKDLIMEVFLMNFMNLLVMILLLISTILTVSYNFRLIMYLNFNVYSLNYMNFNESKNMCLSMVFLMLMSLICGKLMIFMFFYSYEIILSLMNKIMVLLLCILGMLMGYYMYLNNFNKISIFCGSMFYMMFFYKFIYIYVFELSSIFMLMFEKNFIENKFSLMFIKFHLMFYMSFNKINFLNLLIVFFIFLLIFML